jgi:hypothetical protein
MSDLAIIDHGDNRSSRYLRQHRLRIALVIAAVEGVLVLAGVIPWWLVVLLAVGAVAAYVWIRDDTSRPELRQAAWVAAFSQLVLVLLPVAAAILTALAVVVLVLIAVGALVALLLERH